MKDLKISRELISEVLKLEVVKHSLFNKRNNTFNITYMQSEDSLKANWMPVSVYEFAFKCKEWAVTKGFIIESSHNGVQGLATIFKIGGEEITESFYKDTEIECIIEACERLLKERI